MSDQYLVMWCNEGLEGLVNITDLESNDLLTMIKTGQRVTSKVSHYVTMMSMRARANSQRHYEIYGLTVAEGITEQDIRGMFDDDPQTAADTIRRIGARVYSERATHNKTVII